MLLNRSLLLSAFGLPLLVLSASTTPAYGQSISCQATSVPPVVRAESWSDLLGDIVLVCFDNTPAEGSTGGAGGGVAPVPATVATDIQVSLNVDVTNNIGFGAGADIADAVLVVNENNCQAPAATGSTFGDTAECAGTNSGYQRPQYGRLVAPNRLEWNNVAVPIPGVDPDGPGPLPANLPTTTLRVTSLRGAPAQLGVPDAATFPSTQVTASLDANPSSGALTVVNDVLNVAVPIRGLLFEAPSQPVYAKQCGVGEAVVPVTLREGFATAFKPQGSPSFYPGNAEWETGYYAPGSNDGGGASQSTRMLLRFQDIPEGVNVFAPTVVDSSPPGTDEGPILRLLTGTDQRGAGGALAPGEGLTAVALSGGDGFVFYEVVQTDPSRIEEAVVDVTLEWQGDAGLELPALGQGVIGASLAPLSEIDAASGPEPEPRFFDTFAPLPLVDVSRCTTELLFSAINVQPDGGLDADIHIANPSGSLSGVPAQSGACTLHYHGQTLGGGAPPADQTSAPIGPGESLTMRVSEGDTALGLPGAPSFTGYLIATCDFHAAKGRAVIRSVPSGEALAAYDAETLTVSGVTGRAVERSALLLPRVTAADGFETRVFIANTTEDWLGTTPVDNGSCTVTYLGDNAPGPGLISDFDAGEARLFDISGGNPALGVPPAPDFEGALLVDCDFPEARAFARIEKRSAQDVRLYSHGETAQRLTPVAPAAPLTIEGEATATRLLLPAVDNRGRSLTEITLVNATVDPAVTPQAGECQIGFVPQPGDPVPSQSLIALDPGASHTFPPPADFSGQINVACTMLARGFAATVQGDPGAPAAAFGQDAEVVETPRDAALSTLVLPGLAPKSRIRLVNTSLDLFGTTAQSGDCWMQLRGPDAPADFNLTLAAGERLDLDLSQLAPDFSGFLAADCDAPHIRAFDFAAESPAADGIGVIRNGTSWFLDDGDLSWSGCTVDGCADFGLPGNQPLVGDWNGDGRDQIGAYQGGLVFLDYNGNLAWDGCQVDRCAALGLPIVDVPLVGDWNGDGKDQIGIYRFGKVFLDYNGNLAWDDCQVDRCGALGLPIVDAPLVGDWNGDGKDQIGIWRLGLLYLDANGNLTWDGCGTDVCGAFGIPGDKPFVGDWTGSGVERIGVGRGSQIFLDLDGSQDGSGCGVDACTDFGLSGTPLVGDWNGDGRDQAGVFQNGELRLDRDGDHTWEGCDIDACGQFGIPGDTPVVGRW